MVSLFPSPLNVIYKVTNSFGYLRESLSSVLSSVMETRPIPWMQDPEQGTVDMGDLLLLL